MANNPTTPKSEQFIMPADVRKDEEAATDPTRICWTQLLRDEPDEEHSPKPSATPSGDASRPSEPTPEFEPMCSSLLNLWLDQDENTPSPSDSQKPDSERP